MNGQRVLVTGAAGSLASDIIPLLREAGLTVLGFDSAVAPRVDIDGWTGGSIQDRDAIRTAATGVDAIIHLAGIPLETDWTSILETNIDGTQSVLQAAVDAGVRKVVLASSIHATGYTPVPPTGTKLPDDVPVRPNTFYGVSKAAVETLGSMYHDRYGLDVVALRIASRFTKPTGARMLASWLSPADAARLFLAALAPAATGFRLVWGVSANTRSYYSPDGGRAIGYVPVDDAEVFAAEVAGRADDPDEVFTREWDERFIGGVFSSPEPPRFRSGN
jgi:uronate dehydrogenase